MRKIEFTMDNVAKWLKESTDWLIDNQQGCCTLKLDDHLAICVGWSAGYGDEERDDVIQAKDDRDYAINAGIKVSLVDINKSDFGFKPDTKNNQILFGGIGGGAKVNIVFVIAAGFAVFSNRINRFAISAVEFGVFIHVDRGQSSGQFGII